MKKRRVESRICKFNILLVCPIFRVESLTELGLKNLTPLFLDYRQKILNLTTGVASALSNAAIFYYPNYTRTLPYALSEETEFELNAQKKGVHNFYPVLCFFKYFCLIFLLTFLEVMLIGRCQL